PPLGARRPLARSCAATSAGNRTLHSAVALRAVAALCDTSTMAGRPASSRWVSLAAGDLRVANSTSDQVHLDVLARRGRIAADLAVAILAPRPQACQVPEQRGLALRQ